MTTSVTGDLPAEQDPAGPEPATATSQSASPAAGSERDRSRPTSSPIAPSAVGRIPELAVSPVVVGGRFTAKAVVGEPVRVAATVFREGHVAVAPTAVLGAA